MQEPYLSTMTDLMHLDENLKSDWQKVMALKKKENRAKVELHKSADAVFRYFSLEKHHYRQSNIQELGYNKKITTSTLYEVDIEIEKNKKQVFKNIQFAFADTGMKNSNLYQDHRTFLKTQGLDPTDDVTDIRMNSRLALEDLYLSMDKGLVKDELDRKGQPDDLHVAKEMVLHSLDTICNKASSMDGEDITFESEHAKIVVRKVNILDVFHPR